MIRCDLGRLSIKGKPAVICAELEDIIKAVEKEFTEMFDGNREQAREMIDDIVAHSRKTQEEKDEEYKKISESFKKEMEKIFFKDLLQMMEEEDDE